VSTNVPIGNTPGVRGDMDIKDAYMDVGRYDYMEVIGRAKQDARAENNAGAITESDLFLIFPYRGLYSTDGYKQGALKNQPTVPALTSMDGGNAIGLSRTILAHALTAFIHPCTSH